MISIKTNSEIELMRFSGKVNSEVLNLIEEKIKEGITTKELDTIANEYILSKGCTPSFLGYEGYPATICTSINEEVVHGIPSNRKLKNGDIISVDVGVIYKGFHSDAARTYVVGEVSDKVSKLVEHTKEALFEGLAIIKEGIKLNEVCSKIEDTAIKYNYGVILELTGHGVGKELHEDPYIPNYRNTESENIVLKSGMTLAIEPMLSLGSPKVWILENNWTVATQDYSPVAHFEHTILVTKEGYEIITGE